MKKALLALFLMLTLLGASLWNVRHLDAFTDELTASLENSRACWERGETPAAVLLAEEALGEWFSAEGYTHVFIRHAEVDGVTDAFYDLLAALGEDDSAVGRAYDRLEARLHMIDAMEHVTVKSVF